VPGFLLAAALFSLSQEEEWNLRTETTPKFKEWSIVFLRSQRNGLKWARERESERLDQEPDVVDWGSGDKNDEGYLIEELAEPLPTHSFNHQDNSLAAI
jgi:hypothetical protein